MLFRAENIFWVVFAAAVLTAGMLWFGGGEGERLPESTVVPAAVDHKAAPRSKRIAVKRRRGAVAVSTPVSGQQEVSRPAVPDDPDIGKIPADAIAGEYLFRFYNAADRAAFEEYAGKHGIRIIDSMVVGNVVRIGIDDRSILKELLRSGPVAVDWMPNTHVRIPEQEDNNPLAPRDGYQAFGNRALEWLGVSDNSGWGSGITVAVLDSGVKAAGGLRGRSITQLDLTGGAGGVGRGADEDAVLHGSAVASIIAGEDAAARGVAPGVDVISIKVMPDSGSGDAFTLAKGIIEAVDRGANIINMSLGGQSDSFVVRDAVAYAVERGVLLVAAAGNDAVSGVIYPARYEDVMAVAAVDFRNEHLYFSNRGPEVDIAAPGAGVAVSVRDDDSAVLFSGTSAAAPFIAGAAAAIWSLDRDLSPDAVRNLLVDYSNDVGAPGRDDFFGAGVVNMGRVVSRDTAGIYDMAVMVPYIGRDDDSSAGRVNLSAQNRGTESIAEVEMEVQINGRDETFAFYNVEPGETISRPFDLGEAAAEELDIYFSVKPSGVSDSNPDNNAIYSRIIAGKESP